MVVSKMNQIEEIDQVLLLNTSIKSLTIYFQSLEGYIEWYQRSFYFPISSTQFMHYEDNLYLVIEGFDQIVTAFIKKVKYKYFFSNTNNKFHILSDSKLKENITYLKTEIGLFKGKMRQYHYKNKRFKFIFDETISSMEKNLDNLYEWLYEKKLSKIFLSEPGPIMTAPIVYTPKKKI